MRPFRPPPKYEPPSAAAQKTLYACADYLVVDKPAGLLSVPGIGPEKQICAVSYASDTYGPIYVVHRLDMDTSGLLLLARTPEMQKYLAGVFEKRAVRKRYQALVDGAVTDPSGHIDLAVARYSKQRPLRHLEAGGRPAITDWKRLEVAEDHSYSRLDLYPQTGRSHQLRLHMQAIGHPILGDPFYGDVTRFRRLALHASYLAFSPAPKSDEKVFFSPIPF